MPSPPLTLGVPYPLARRDESISETIHGKIIPDPYRWLEDLESEETKGFVEAQNALCRPFLNNWSLRDEVHKDLLTLSDFQSFSCPVKRGSKYYMFKNTGRQNQSVLYEYNGINDKAPREIFDPNLLSPDGTIAAPVHSFSEDGQTWAYGLTISGSDWIKIQFRDVATGQTHSDVLEHVKFSRISWTHDNLGVFYGCYMVESASGGQDPTKLDKSMNLNQKLYYHFIGSEQKDDVLIAEFPQNPKMRPSAQVSHCGEYLIDQPFETCTGNAVRIGYIVQALKGRLKDKINLTPVIEGFDAKYDYISNVGTTFYFWTNKGAPNNKVIVVNMKGFMGGQGQGPPGQVDLVPEHTRNVLQFAVVVNNSNLVLAYMEDVKYGLEVRRLSDGVILHKVPHPQFMGTIPEHSYRTREPEYFFKAGSFLTPGKIYRMDLSNKNGFEPKVIFESPPVPGFDPKEFTVSQVFYPSKDKTRVPMFIMHRSDFVNTGGAPCFLHAYGGFRVCSMPSFSAKMLLLARDFGFVCAVANIRGGGEYGKAWHDGGRGLQKQNSFDDFQAAAEYLITHKFTSPAKLVINGGSNGGLLIGACINQRPDLFKVAIIEVGVLDMLRYDKFTIGHYWSSEYGSPEDKEAFEYMLTYSPLHCIRGPFLGPGVSDPGIQYPATLLLTADHDDRVVPSHTFKFTAELQYTAGRSPQQLNPLLLSVDTNSGHGFGKPTGKKIEQDVDIISFIGRILGF